MKLIEKYLFNNESIFRCVDQLADALIASTVKLKRG